MKRLFQRKLLISLLTNYPVILVYQQYELKLLQFKKIKKFQFKKRFCVHLNENVFRGKVIVVYNFYNFCILRDQLDVTLIISFWHFNGKFAYFIRVSKFLKLLSYFKQSIAPVVSLSFILRSSLFWGIQKIRLLY